MTSRLKPTVCEMKERPLQIPPLMKCLRKEELKGTIVLLMFRVDFSSFIYS